MMDGNQQYQQALVAALMNQNGGVTPTDDQVQNSSNPLMQQFAAGAPPSMTTPGMSPFAPQQTSQNPWSNQQPFSPNPWMQQK